MGMSVFGIRHHGPGCARSLRAALEALEPDIILVEGPPDAQNVLSLLSHEEMKPPVALLIYAPDEPRRAAYYPFTYFSPEWQALHYAAQRSIPARFMDLPQAIQLAREPLEKTPLEEKQGTAKESSQTKQTEATLDAPPAEATPTIEDDPLAMLAQAAGYTDHELWWEREIEQRRDE